MAAHDGDGIGTFELLTGLMHRLPKAFTALAKTMNQMCDDLSVRLGMKDIALAGERFAQRVMVFNNAVMDNADGQTITLRQMGVGIAVGHTPMRCPAGMGNAQGCGLV